MSSLAESCRVELVVPLSKKSSTILTTVQFEEAVDHCRLRLMALVVGYWIDCLTLGPCKERCSVRQGEAGQVMEI